ncbi:MAG: DUF1905 domain-containing protein [Saprospiraceae bacterium]|nr:DUF1905 domain-containing protein [Saprospiraceae bacterium]
MSKIDAIYPLEKFPGKGGWTYAAIPEIAQNPANPFGWVSVKGTIDGVPIQTKLMPMGNGQLFLPVKASLRKTIRKSQGDTVHIVLELDEMGLEIPEELESCLRMESNAIWTRFISLPESKRSALIKWIYEAKMEETRAMRIAELIDKLLLDEL